MAIKFGGLELATPGDIIVAGGAYAVGFAVDAFFFSGGATSSTTAGACAIGALSAKYAVQSVFKRLRPNKDSADDVPVEDRNRDKPPPS